MLLKLLIAFDIYNIYLLWMSMFECGKLTLQSLKFFIITESEDIDIIKIGKTDANLPSPIDLNFRVAKEVAFPSLKWKNADEIPRLMKISNSGHSGERFSFLLVSNESQLVTLNPSSTSEILHLLREVGR